MPAGRPTDYNEEIASELCGYLSTGESLRTVCKRENMPCTSTVFVWLRKHKEFVDQYEKAKQEAADAIVEEILDIADNGVNDYIERLDEAGEPTGAYQYNGEHVQRSRLRVDARKWIASKLKPKKYGDSITTKHTGSIGLTDLSEDELDRKLQQLDQELKQSERE